MNTLHFLLGSSASELDEKLKLQQQESTRRENVLVMRLATKEQEMQELVVGTLSFTLNVCILMSSQ